MENKPMKKITVLLTRYSDWFGRFICGISSHGYSHASISIDEEVFYSFNTKGFVVEKPKKEKPKKRQPGSACIYMLVPQEIYCAIEKEICRFEERKEQYAYSRLGVVLCLLHIPHKIKNRYFCSQFVAEVLQRTGAVQLKKHESLYLPGQLIDGVECLFSKKEVVYSPE